MDIDDAVINSCRVCQSEDQDGDFEWLYKDDMTELSAAGQLYEELLGAQINFDTASIYPQYLCNSCDLQMRLFKKLKIKAIKTLETLNAKNFATFQTLEKQQQQIKQNAFIVFDIKKEGNTKLEILDGALNLEAFHLDMKINDHSQDLETQYSTDKNSGLELEESNEGALNTAYHQLLDDAKQEQLEFLDEYESLDNEMPLEQVSETAMHNTECESVGFESEVYELVTEGEDLTEEAIETQNNIVDNNYLDLHNETSQETTMTPANNEFIEVHFLDESCPDESEFTEMIKETEKKPEHKVERKNFCRICEEHYLTKTDFLKHKKAYHSIKFPCAVCGKIFQTADAHNVHQKLHWGEPAYQCELCNKTFNQKVHYNYHMAKHNNIRNFKCEICGKAFLAKGDLAIHTRTHTGDRRYSCDICQKEFLLLVHMKNHRFSHFEKNFECKICNQKFISPSTLRMHTASIHENEPRFQCSFCVKKFRRKHHLIAHYKVHQKQLGQEKFTESLINCDEETLQDENSRLFSYIVDLQQA